MDSISGRPGRPVAQREPVQQHSVQRPNAEAPRMRVEPPKKNKKSLILKIAGLLIAGALLAGLVYAYKTSVGVPIESGKYQAVFLTNGQVYFGKLHRAGEYYKLTDVYYLQATQSSSESSSSNPQQAAQANSGVQLIKLGNEVHGPEDAMIIDKSQVLFFENLKNDGKVVDSISKYQKK
jgi:hypothetical protein